MSTSSEYLVKVVVTGAKGYTLSVTKCIHHLWLKGNLVYILSAFITSLSQITMLLSAECSCRRPSSAYWVNGHDFVACSVSKSMAVHLAFVMTILFAIFCRLPVHWSRPVWKLFTMDHSWCGKSKYRWIVESDTKVLNDHNHISQVLGLPAQCYVLSHDNFCSQCTSF